MKSKDDFIESQSKFLKDDLSFTLWDKFKGTNPLFRFNINNFIKNIIVDEPKKLNPNYLWILNNCEGGKQQINFKCPQVVFIDIDFHLKDERLNGQLIKLFLNDVGCDSQIDFLKKISNDEYCLLGGLSRSGVGIRLVFLVQTQYSMYCHFEDGYNTTTEQNIKIHTENWLYVMKYLNINYGLDISNNCQYSMRDKSASGIQQGTYFIRKEHSFTNKDCKWLFNPYLESDDKDGYNENKDFSSVIEGDWNYADLEQLYNENFINSLSSWEPYLKLLEYVLPYYVEREGNVIEFFYDKMNESYQGSSTIHKFGLSNFENHYSKKNVKHMPLDIWLRIIGIPISIEKNNYVEI